MKTANRMKTRSLIYAEEAWDCVSQIRCTHETSAVISTTQKDYRSHALHLPTMILQCGLAQTLAFVLHKSNREKDKDKNAYSLWLSHLVQCLNVQEAQEDLALIQHVQKADLMGYLLLTEQAIEAASWLKRYAEALIPASATPKVAVQENSND